MSAFRKLQKGVSKGVLQSTRVLKVGAGAVKDGTIGIINEAKEGIKEGLQDDKELKRSNSGHFHESDDEDPDLRMSLAVNQNPNKNTKKNFVAGYSMRPGIDESDDNGAGSDDEMYLEPVSEAHEGEIGLNDDDDNSTGAKVAKKKKKIKKVKYRKSGDDSDGSDASAKSSKSTKSSKSSKSGKARKKKVRANRSDLSSVGSRRKKDRGRDTSPTRQLSSASAKSETSTKKKKKKKAQTFDSSDDDDEHGDVLSPLTEKKRPVLPTRSRSKSPGRSPSRRTFEDTTPPLSPVSSTPTEEHPIKQELQRFSDIWKSQAGDGERESIKVSQISALMGELKEEVKESDPFDNDFLDAKLRSTEQKLLDSEAKVEELIVKKSDIQKELNEEQLRNDELGRKLLYLEDRVEELEAEKKELEAQPKTVEQQADPIEVFELQQEVNQLKTDMSIKSEHHAEALFSKDERIKELEAKLEAAEAGGGVNKRESIASIHSAVSHTSDARTQGLLLRSQDKIQKQEDEIRELKQKLQELGNADIIEQKEEEITNLGVQMSELETKMKEMEDEHEKALKQKEETINFFQTQVVEMQKKMPKPAAYSAREKVGTEGTMSLDGDGSEEQGPGLWGAIASASPGWLGGRQTVDRRKAREAPNAPNL